MAVKLPIYMDNHATTPVDPRVIETMLPYFTEKFGNAASRNHSFGWAGEEAVENARAQVAALITIMYANNEIGVINPIAEIGKIAKEHGIFFAVDGVQAVGKVPVDVQKDNIDLLAISAHKIYGPKGVGALYVRRRNPRVQLSAIIDGGGHERGMRSGTLNVPGIVGLGKACELCP